MNLIENKEKRGNFIIIWIDTEENKIYKSQMDLTPKTFIEYIYDNDYRKILYLFSIKRK